MDNSYKMDLISRVRQKQQAAAASRRPGLDQKLGIGPWLTTPPPSYGEPGPFNNAPSAEGPMPPEMANQQYTPPAAPAMDEGQLKMAWEAMDMHQKRMFMDGPGSGFENFKMQMQQFPQGVPGQ